jgi:hypothetical protein
MTGEARNALRHVILVQVNSGSVRLFNLFEELSEAAELTVAPKNGAIMAGRKGPAMWLRYGPLPAHRRQI